MNIIVKRVLLFIVCIATGIGIGIFFFYSAPALKQFFYAKPSVYVALDQTAILRTQQMPQYALEWSSLIPENEKQILQKYQTQTQAGTALEFGDQLILSIEASADKAYISAMHSSNTVEDVDGRHVSISGYIVPIDFSGDKKLKDIFIVPYFGACIHFPAPAPNQMIFAQLSSKFTNFDITQAYTIKGILRREMFDDKLGTAAYSIDVSTIELYFGEPDDFRQH